MTSQPRPATEFCPYCGEDRARSDFTKEHVLPQALGGNLQPSNPFSISACGRCNSTCGRYVDGRFIRSWLIHNWRAESHRRTYDPKNSVLSLVWFGKLADWSGIDGTVADFWLGPAGDLIYHFHEPYPDVDATVFAGRPPHVPLARTDPGAVYVALRSGTNDWLQTLMRSLTKTFGSEASLHFLNAAPAGYQTPYPVVPRERHAHVEWISSRRTDEPLQARFAVDADWGVRFLAKFGLGLGVAVLEPGYDRSAYADELRKALWSREPASRQSIRVRGRGFLNSDPTMTKLLGWSDCHSILLRADGSRLMAILTLYGQAQASIVVADDPLFWRARFDEEGTIWVIAPGFGRYEGPMPLSEYFHAANDDTSASRLSKLRAILVSGQPLPSLPRIESAQSPGTT